MELYFAYGSNLNMKQMRRRCPSAVFSSKAILREYRLAFPLLSKRWDGGVAGIIADKEEIVEGVVYKISEEDLKRLDKFENVDKGTYYRKKIRVILDDGFSTEAWTYFPNPDAKSLFSPSQRYLRTIRKGAEEHKLSQQFINKLRHIDKK